MVSGSHLIYDRQLNNFVQVKNYDGAKISEINSLQFNPKGEVTVVISGKKDRQKNKLNESDKKKIKQMIKSLSIKDIVNLIYKDKEISKKEIYNFCLSLKK